MRVDCDVKHFFSNSTTFFGIKIDEENYYFFETTFFP